MEMRQLLSGGANEIELRNPWRCKLATSKKKLPSGAQEKWQLVGAEVGTGRVHCTAHTVHSNTPVASTEISRCMHDATLELVEDWISQVAPFVIRAYRRIP